LGGYDRGLDYSELLAALSNYDLGTLILMGDVGRRLSETEQVTKLAAGSVVTRKTKNLTCALEDLVLMQGDLILLSPGASSFDSYRDYIHRGEEFALEVKRTVRDFKLI
jgi:UDP-N-acetylmuramoylalanine--D-glutamate ligase